MTVWTIGHSTHELDAFVKLLLSHAITAVADVRTVPKSRRHPQYDTVALEQSLPARGIEYGHFARLGGWRRATVDSPNGAWRNVSFRGYADYAMSAEFAHALEQLRHLAAVRHTAVMCAEALWWRCHRRIIADRLVHAGDVVCHIGADGRSTRHRLPEFARIGADGQITYP